MIKKLKYPEVLIYISLIAITLAVFGQTCNFEFINYDDNVYVYENQHIYTGFSLDNIKWLFTKDVGRWHPLTGLTHMLDCELFGLNPGKHHLTNLFIHLVNTLLLFAIFKKVTNALWQSAFLAALFAIHPLHVESVAWISGRKDLLSNFFWILTLGAYFQYVEKRRVSWYAASLVLFALGLMAKPMIVTLPFVLLLLDYWPLNRIEKINWQSWRGLIFEKIPFFSVAVLASIVTFFLFKAVGQVQSIDILPLIFRINNAFISYLKYIGKTIWPADLAVVYPYSENLVSKWMVIAAAVVLVVTTIRIIRLSGKYKYLPVGWFMFLGTLVPVIGFIQISDAAMADRYTYLSLTGLFIILAWGITDLLNNSKRLLAPAFLTFILIFTICSYFQTRYWRNSEILFEHAIKVTKGNFVAYNNLGTVQNESGQIDLAIVNFSKAIEANPKFYKAYINRGNAYAKINTQFKSALEDFNKAVELNSKDPDAYYNRGTFYSQIQGQYDIAISDFTKVLELNPTYLKAHNNRGISYYRINKYDLAIADYQKELEINPNNVETYTNRGNVFWQGKNRPDLAIADYNKALQMNPKMFLIYYNKAGACVDAGLKKDALELYKKFIATAPPEYAQLIEQAKEKIKNLEQ